MGIWFKKAIYEILFHSWRIKNGGCAGHDAYILAMGVRWSAILILGNKESLLDSGL